MTNICTCGHSIDEHHGNFIMNLQALRDAKLDFRNVNGILYGECEHSFVNGERVNEQDPICHCNTYWDTEWPKK